MTLSIPRAFARPAAAVAFALCVAAAPSATNTTPPQTRALPERLTSAEFWKLQAELSEPGGYFRIEDNYTSNEMEVGELAAMLRARNVRGGVYLGVGPEQNFSYIAAIRPRMAFIVDIRRQAAVQHLMYKAVFEMAKDRAEFISLLFSKPRPAGLDSATAIEKIWDAFTPIASDSAMSTRTWNAIVERLTKTHGFTLNEDESAKLRGVYNAFYYFGPGISTRGNSQQGRGGSASFADLTGYSRDATGYAQSFLSTEDNFRYIKSLHEKNLLVPLTGDFGGTKAIRAVGAWLKERGATVSAFYVSNVEQYLFQDVKADAFYGNVGTLPLDSASVFIRPYSMRRGSAGVTRSLCPIVSFLDVVRAGRVFNNNVALACG